MRLATTQSTRESAVGAPFKLSNTISFEETSTRESPCDRRARHPPPCFVPSPQHYDSSPAPSSSMRPSRLYVKHLALLQSSDELDWLMVSNKGAARPTHRARFVAQAVHFLQSCRHPIAISSDKNTNLVSKLQRKARRGQATSEVSVNHPCLPIPNPTPPPSPLDGLDPYIHLAR